MFSKRAADAALGIEVISMGKLKFWLKKIKDNPTLNLLAAGILLVSTLLEMTDSTLLDVSIGAHHGLLIFSAFHILKCIPDFLGAIDLATYERQ
jgi:hypothetical protein